LESDLCVGSLRADVGREGVEVFGLPVNVANQRTSNTRDFTWIDWRFVDPDLSVRRTLLKIEGHAADAS
jgi:hypothetical protein